MVPNLAFVGKVGEGASICQVCWGGKWIIFVGRVGVGNYMPYL